MNTKGEPVLQYDKYAKAEEITSEIRRGEVRTHWCSFATRTSLIRELGGYRPYFVTCPDVDLQFRVGDRSRVWYEPRPAYVYRIHDASVTHRHSIEINEFYERVVRECQRQRLRGLVDDVDRGCPPNPEEATGDTQKTAADQISGQLTGRAWELFSEGRRGEALAEAWRVCTHSPLRYASWRNLAVLLVKSLRKQEREGKDTG